MTYVASPDRYEQIPYRRCGRSGIELPAVSLGLWQNFGDTTAADTQREIIRRAFDRGVTHIDLANNYGPPYGSAEVNFGRILREDLRSYRDELVISTKAGYDMWPGPTATAGRANTCSRAWISRCAGWAWSTSTSSTATARTRTRRWRRRSARSPRRCGPARRSTRGSPPTPLSAPRMPPGSPGQLGTPLLIHQPSYSMLNRWIEHGLLDVLEREGIGCIAFSPLAQGMLTGKYLRGIPAGSRASRPGSLSRDLLSNKNLAHVRALNEIAQARGQTLAQLALAWALRDARVTSVLIGASSTEQLEENLAAVGGPPLSAEELAAIDGHAVEAGVNIWARSSAS